jgi:hypothetical protein
MDSKNAAISNENITIFELLKSTILPKINAAGLPTTPDAENGGPVKGPPSF